MCLQIAENYISFMCFEAVMFVDYSNLGAHFTKFATEQQFATWEHVTLPAHLKSH